MTVEWREKFSLGSRGSRYYLGIAIALITVIPSLVLFYLLFVEPRIGGSVVGRGPVLVVMLLLNMALGYVLLSWYPRNIVRLRRYLEDMIEGRMPEKVMLVSEMDDILTIESYMNMLIEQLSRRVSKMEGEVEERRRAEKLKDDFVSTVSHELRTPLAITKEGIGLVLDGIAGETTEKQQQILGRARVSIDRLARIIDDLLDISKIEAGRMDLRRQETDLGPLVEASVTGIRGLAEQKGLYLRSSVGDEELPVFVDDDRIVQVLTNLLSNAVRYTEAGGIEVTAATVEDTVACSVKDTGIGVAKDDLPNLFDKFTQFGRKHGEGLKGTGLGLAIVHNILELHGGTIGVDSEPGVGTTVTFVLPRCAEGSAARYEIEERVTRAREAQERMGVLLFRMERKPLEGGEDASPEEAGFDWGDSVPALQEKARASDFVATDELQDLVILIGSCGGDELVPVLARWAMDVLRVSETGAPGSRWALNCGHSSYPGDGAEGGELLDAAKRRMVPAEQLVENA